MDPEMPERDEAEWTARLAERSIPGLPATIPPLRIPPGKLPGRTPPEPVHQYVRPDYAARFKCIAAACEDTCCKGWDVPVDRRTYEKYRSSEAMKPHLGTLIVLNTNKPTASDYARIPLMGTTQCAFLDVERMCGIQKQLGAEMLPDTCATYPRANSRQAGRVETALNLSCPEAARLTLLEDNLFGSGHFLAGGAPRYEAFRAAAPGWPHEETRLAVREFALLLLTDRSYSLWQRLYLLQPLVRRLRTLSDSGRGGSVLAWCEGNPLAVAHVLADSAQIAAGGRLRQVMDAIPPRTSEQLQLVMEMLRMRVFRPPSPTRFLECVQDFELGLGCATASSEQQILDAYDDGYRRFYQPLMERYPHLLENYLVNHVFKNGYPFGRQPEHPAAGFAAESNPEREHLSLCVHAGLAQTLLIGMAARHRENFSSDHVVKLVQSLARAIEHSKEFLEQLMRFAEERNLNSPQGIAMLLHPILPPGPTPRGAVTS
jgi:lysine-N-methylase